MSKYWYYNSQGVVVEVAQRFDTGKYEEWGVKCVIFDNPRFGRPDQVGLFMNRINAVHRDTLITKLSLRNDFSCIFDFNIRYFKHIKDGTIYREYKIFEEKFQMFDGFNGLGNELWCTTLGRSTFKKKVREMTEERFKEDMAKRRMMQELVR